MKRAKKYLYIIYIRILKGLLVMIGLRKSNLSKFMDSIVFELRMFLFIFLILIGMGLFLLITGDSILTLSNIILKLNILLIILICTLMVRVLLKIKLYRINSCLNNNQSLCDCGLRNLVAQPHKKISTDSKDEQDEHNAGSKI
jgi:hypothetical protein